MRRKLLVSLGLAALLLLILPGQISYATPSPLYILVNDSTNQCYVTIMNDECFWCDPPQGWRIWGPGDPGYGRTDCPAGFTKIDRLEMNCTRYKSRECCGGFSSIGNCNDMIVNATQQACAFVDSVNACVLPEGWSKRPEGTLAPPWVCNYQYHWVDNVSCLTATQTPEALSIEKVAAQHPEALPVTGLGLIVLGGGVLAWLAKKRPRT